MSSSSPVSGWRKRKPVRVQELPLEAEVAPHAVLRVSGDGQVDRGEVHADLVRAARLQANVEERVLAHELDDLEVRDRLSRLLRVERPLGRIATIAAQRRVDATRSRARRAADEREVAALELAPPDRLLQRRVRLLRAGDDQEARRVAVEPVHDARPLRIAVLRPHRA